MAMITEIHGYVGGDLYVVEFKAGGEVFVIRDVPVNNVPGLGQTFNQDKHNPYMYSLEFGERNYRVQLRSRLTDFVLLEEIIEKDSDE